MGLASSIYAEYAEGMREQWLEELELAYAQKDWELVEKLIAEMKKFHFYE